MKGKVESAQASLSSLRGRNLDVNQELTDMQQYLAKVWPFIILYNEV